MKIMKMWRNTTLFAYFRFMGYVMMIVGIYLIVNGIGDYAGQSRQKDWIPIEATVTDVSSEVVSSSPGRHGSNSSTYYIMAYEYAVDGETYTGRTGRMSSPRLIGTVITVKYNPIMAYEYAVDGETYTGRTGRMSSPRLIGTVITVKYNPEVPEENTAILSPNTHNLLVLLILGTAIAVVGFFLSGVLELLRSLLRRTHTEELKKSVPETDTGFDSTAIAKIPAKQWVPRLAAWLLAFVALVLFVKFFLTSGTSDLDKFRKAAAAAGYTAVDSTEDIRQSWGIGSMLIRSVSVHEDSLRLDYCRLDSADACYRFYAAATLPITGEVTESNTFTGQVYAVDSPTNFAAKIRSGQIMLYVYTTQEGKADVLAFLEAAGWWSE